MPIAVAAAMQEISRSTATRQVLLEPFYALSAEPLCMERVGQNLGLRYGLDAAPPCPLLFNMQESE